MPMSRVAGSEYHLPSNSAQKRLPMQIIPVIDIKQGQVVLAHRGERDAYRPIQTPFSSSAEPLAVVAGLRRAFDVDALYVADLDAIGGARCDCAAIAQISAEFPDTTLWLDAGLTAARDFEPLRDLGSVHVVLATESLASVADYEQLLEAVGTPRALLSLDYDRAGPRGCAELFARPEIWPRRVIHMALTQVGAAMGPDWTGLERLRGLAGAREIYAAGGVRHSDDLRRLRQLGVSGALLATALHQQRVTASDIESLRTAS